MTEWKGIYSSTWVVPSVCHWVFKPIPLHGATKMLCICQLHLYHHLGRTSTTTYSGSQHARVLSTFHHIGYLTLRIFQPYCMVIIQSPMMDAPHIIAQWPICACPYKLVLLLCLVDNLVVFSVCLSLMQQLQQLQFSFWQYAAIGGDTLRHCSHSLEVHSVVKLRGVGCEYKYTVVYQRKYLWGYNGQQYLMKLLALTFPP